MSKKKREKFAADPRELKSSDLPTGRVSVEETSLTELLNSFITDYTATQAKFPIDLLEVMQNLSLANPDVSQMVENIVQLGNTGHNVVVTASESQQARVMDEISNIAKTVFSSFGGIDGFINSVLGQVARGGAGSVEWVVEQRLRGLSRVVFVPLQTIRFFLDREAGYYEPYQKLADYNLGKVGYIELNTNTYQYVALQLLDNSPYAVPPILAALEPIMIQRDIIKNFRFVAKKLGLLGFVTFLLKAPMRIPGEEESAYLNRCQMYLRDQAEMIKHNYRDGLALGFKDNFEVQHSSLMGSAQGASEIFTQVEQQVFSGLKTDPALHGRSYSTTETYAGVVYEKMLSSLTNYQRLVASILEYGYKLHLSLLGLQYEDLYVEFEKSKSLQSERDEQAFATKVDSLGQLLDRGIISRQQYANELGYDSPYLEEDPRTADVQNQSEPLSKKRVLRFSRKSNQYEALPIKRPRIELAARPAESEGEDSEKLFYSLFGTHDGCCSFAADSGDELLEDFMLDYFKKIYPKIKGSRTRALGSMGPFLKNYPYETADSEMFANDVFNKLAEEFGDEFASSGASTVIKNSVNKFYKQFRLYDNDPFGGDPAPVRPSFDLVDERAVKFLRESDDFYFGRYITDPATKKSLKGWLADDFLQSGRSLRDPGELAEFRKRFGNRVAKEDYKVVRVVETSVSRAKNWGNILTVNQAKGSKIKIAGPVDNLTCKWCEAMVGNPAKEIKPKEFAVAPVVQLVKDTISKTPEELPQMSPFVVNKYNPAVLKEVSEEQLVAQGIALPPYHPHCRHRFIVSEFE